MAYGRLRTGEGTFMAYSRLGTGGIQSQRIVE